MRGEPKAFAQPGGISWQAQLLNFVSRRLIKRRIERHGLAPRSMRRVIRLLELTGASWQGFATVHRKRIAGVPCDVVYPLNPPPVERVLLYLHGGGFCVHLPRSYRQFARRLAEAFGATVYLPAYRLAPEHRYPSATDDCLAVYKALVDIEGHDPRQLGLMGDSAGGNLALVTLQRARDERLPMPSCAILLSPCTDLGRVHEGGDGDGDGSAVPRRNAEADPMIPVSALRLVVDQYVDAADRAHPHASPLRGKFKGLPPLKILAGSTEVLLDDAIDAARACRAAGVDVDLQIWEQMLHVFPLIGFLPEGRLALAQMVEFFERHTPST